MGDEKFSKEAFPTQGGVYSAWEPEWYSGDLSLSEDGWQRVPTTKSEHGVPVASANQGINHTIGFFSHAQAQALAWMHAAAAEAQTGYAVRVRVTEYRVHYDIKCYRAAAEIGKATASAGEGGKA